MKEEKGKAPEEAEVVEKTFIEILDNGTKMEITFKVKTSNYNSKDWRYIFSTFAARSRHFYLRVLGANLNNAP